FTDDHGERNGTAIGMAQAALDTAKPNFNFNRNPGSAQRCCYSRSRRVVGLGHWYYQRGGWGRLPEIHGPALQSRNHSLEPIREATSWGCRTPAEGADEIIVAPAACDLVVVAIVDLEHEPVVVAKAPGEREVDVHAVAHLQVRVAKTKRVFHLSDRPIIETVGCENLSHLRNCIRRWARNVAELSDKFHGPRNPGRWIPSGSLLEQSLDDLAWRSRSFI